MVYHGRRRWIKRDIRAYFNQLPDAVAPYVPSFDYVLIDLSTMLERLPSFKTDYARLTGVLLQNSRQRRLLEKALHSIADGINRLLADERGERFFRTSLIYLTWVTSLTKAEVVVIFQDVSKQANNYSMSLYEQLIQEGIEKGLEQGLEQGITRAVKAMLQMNMDAATIAAALELTPEQMLTHINRINEANR